MNKNNLAHGHRQERAHTSTLTVMADTCLFGPAETRIVRDSDTDKIYSLKHYVLPYPTDDLLRRQ